MIGCLSALGMARVAAWYQAAVSQHSGIITAAGEQFNVTFTPLTDPDLASRIDAAYSEKYAGSSYLPPMLGDGPTAATIEITLRD